MIFEIKSRFTGAVLFALETESLNLCVEAAVKSRTDLSRADLSGANLNRASLSGASLSGADLSGANLNRASLSGASLSGASLSGADLSGANLNRADLFGADLDDLQIARLSILPDGDITGWKKLAGGVIAKLRIPADARRSNSTGRKCRAEFVDVLELFGADEAKSINYGKLITYRAGIRVHSDSWDECRWNECSHGIHFYITRAEAESQ